MNGFMDYFSVWTTIISLALSSGSLFIATITYKRTVSIDSQIRKAQKETTNKIYELNKTSEIKSRVQNAIFKIESEKEISLDAYNYIETTIYMLDYMHDEPELGKCITTIKALQNHEKDYLPIKNVAEHLECLKQINKLLEERMIYYDGRAVC